MKRIVLLNGIEETVIIPVFQSVTKDIVKHLKLGSIPIINKDNTLLEKNEGSATIDKNLHNTILQVDYNVVPIEELGGHRVPVHPDTFPFFKDDNSRVTMTTSYRSIKIEFNMRLRSKSRSTISKVIDLLYHRKVDVDSFDTHNIQISYTLPDTVKRLINDIYNIRVKYEDLSKEEFLRTTLNPNMIDATLSLANEQFKDSLVVTEYITKVIGEYTGTYKDTNIEENDTYFEFPINYYITFQRPLAIHLRYPFMIYNEKLNDFFLEPYQEYTLDNLRNHDHALYTIIRQHDNFGIDNRGYYLKYPRYDDHSIPFKYNKYTPIITILSVVNRDSPRELFNLFEDLPNIEFLDNIKELLLETKETISEYLGNLFYFVLYINEEEFKNEEIILEEDGTLKTKNDMDIRNIYRVGIHLCEDITSIKPSIRKKIIDFINREIVDSRLEEDSLSGLNITPIKKEKLFLDVYLNLFNIRPDEVTNMLNNWTSNNARNILFNLKLPDYSFPKLSSLHHTKLYRLFK